MRIAFVASPVGPLGGGMGRVVENLVRSNNGELGGFQLEVLDTRGQGRAILGLPRLALCVGRLWAAGLTGNLGLLHVQMAERGSMIRKVLLMLCAKAFACPVVLHLHSAELADIYERSAPLPRFLIRQSFRLADRCVVLGEYWRHFLVEYVGLSPERIDVVHNGVPEPEERRRPDRPGPVRILFLGNLHARKGLADLLRALAPVSGAWELIVAGGGNPRPFADLAAELGLESRTRFVGWLDRPASQRALLEAEILALPSYQEGLPMVILEAMAAEVAVVATPVGSIGEVLSHGITGLLVLPGDIDALGCALSRLVESESLRRDLATAARRLYEERFTVAAFSRRIAAVYESVQSARGSSKWLPLPRTPL